MHPSMNRDVYNIVVDDSMQIIFYEWKTQNFIVRIYTISKITDKPLSSVQPFHGPGLHCPDVDAFFY